MIKVRWIGLHIGLSAASVVTQRSEADCNAGDMNPRVFGEAAARSTPGLPVTGRRTDGRP